MNKVLIIAGVLLGAGMLVGLILYFSKKSSTGTVAGNTNTVTDTTTHAGNNAAVAVTPMVNDSIEAARDGVIIYDDGMNAVGTKKKNSFIGTVLSVINHGDPKINIVRYRASGNPLNYFRVYQEDVKVHNQ